MQFLSINYSLNKTYNVEKPVFEQATKNAIASCSSAKLKKIKVTITSDKKLYIKIEIIPARKDKLKILFTTIAKKVEENIENLIERKPENIQISLGEKE